jgi:tryptophan 2,3-dioxygenase
MKMDAALEQMLGKLSDKFEADGQSLLAYLEGLLHADYVNYWEYVQVDTLLSLQKPRTRFADEKIFIVYHQITELYFNLCLHEFDQISAAIHPDAQWLKERINRLNHYFEALTTSFGIMVDGMEKKQFLQFRMSLMPASGFQSAQYRMIEIASTDFFNLVGKDHRDRFNAASSISSMFEFIYWKAGATELESGKKTLTLVQFEEKYAQKFIAYGEQKVKNNLWQVFQQLNPEGQNLVRDSLRQLDINVNINWPLVHYKSAVRYLKLDPTDIPATGGTNWQKYLPPRFQKRIFYPALWTEKEVEEWGKSWVDSMLNLRKERIE